MLPTPKDDVWDGANILDYAIERMDNWIIVTEQWPRGDQVLGLQISQVSNV